MIKFVALFVHKIRYMFEDWDVTKEKNGTESETNLGFDRY